MIIFAIYQVEIDKIEKFINLLKQCETVMRQEGLITLRPILRLQSKLNNEFLIEIFEWKNENSFQDAQKNEQVLKLWKTYESLWINGGFGLNKIPESEISWAHFKELK